MIAGCAALFKHRPQRGRRCRGARAYCGAFRASRTDPAARCVLPTCRDPACRIIPAPERFSTLSKRAEPMPATIVTLWLLNILLDTFGQLSFKAAAAQPDLGDGLARWKAMARRPWIWWGIGCYVGEFLVWLAFLSLVPLSEGVLLGSINIVAVMIAGRLLFNEKFSPLRTLGILMIAGGVAVVGLGG